MSSTKRLLRIAPLQLGKMLGALYGAIGLIFVPFFAIFGLIGTFLPKMSNLPNASSAPNAAFAGFGFFLMILFPVMYAAMGFIIGLIGAAIYNLIAKWVGGIEVEVE